MCIPGADKSLARPWNETSYSDQDLQQYSKTYGVKTAGIYPRCLYAISNNNNNNNNNNIYLLQLGCYPVAVVILHVNKT